MSEHQSTAKPVRDVTATSFDKRDSQNGKENLNNKKEKMEEKIKGLNHQDKTTLIDHDDKVSEKDNERSFGAARPRSNKEAEEEEPPKKKQKSSPSTNDTKQVKDAALLKEVSAALRQPFSEQLLQTRITRLEAQLAAALTTAEEQQTMIDKLNRELDKLKAKIAGLDDTRS